MVKLTVGLYVGAVGHRSHAFENPVTSLRHEDLARLRQTSQMRASQTSPYTLRGEKHLKTTHTIPRRAQLVKWEPLANPEKSPQTTTGESPLPVLVSPLRTALR